MTKVDENMVDKRTLNQQMFMGKFQVNIADDMHFAEKVSAYANEGLTYHLYQKGLMMKQLRRSSQSPELKKKEPLPVIINRVLR